MRFDAATAAQLEAFYETRDVRRRRALVLEALAPEPEEHVVDIGCGPGFYAADLLARGTAVTAVDPAPAMREMTSRRAPETTVVDGSATALPLGDASVDRALSVQVLEYVQDVAAALAEARRVLRPGGRLVAWDIDWTTLSLHALDAGRSRRVLDAWDTHLVHPALPRTLGSQMRGAGFADVQMNAHAFACDSLDPQNFGTNSAQLIAAFVGGLDGVAEEADAWLAELRALNRLGAFFYSVTQVCFVATAP